MKNFPLIFDGFVLKTNYFVFFRVHTVLLKPLDKALESLLIGFSDIKLLGKLYYMNLSHIERKANMLGRAKMRP